jgi:hypothetical protein
MDSDTNFLLQIIGNKAVSVFDPNDRSLVPVTKIEEHLAGSGSSIIYDKTRQGDAKVFELGAGEGIHIPSFAPHWARNHDNISVALSFNYDLKSILNRGRICRINRLLGKAGIPVTPSGVSPWRDGIKLSAAHVARTIEDKIRPKPYQGWTPSLH